MLGTGVEYLLFAYGETKASLLRGDRVMLLP